MRAAVAMVACSSFSIQLESIRFLHLTKVVEIKGQAVLEEFKATKVLSVWFLDKSEHYRFIGFVKGMLLVVQTNKQPDWYTRATHPDRVHGAKLHFKGRPVGLISQTIQFMLATKHLIKA